MHPDVTYNASKQLMLRRKEIRRLSLLSFAPIFMLLFVVLGCNWISFFFSLFVSAVIIVLLPEYIEDFLGLEKHEAYVELFKSEGFRGLEEFPDKLLESLAANDIPILRLAFERILNDTRRSAYVVVPHPAYSLCFMLFYYIRMFIGCLPFNR